MQDFDEAEYIKNKNRENKLKVENFKKELIELLNKYSAEIEIARDDDEEYFVFSLYNKWLEIWDMDMTFIREGYLHENLDVNDFEDYNEFLKRNKNK